MNSKIRNAIRKRNRLLKFYCRRKNSITWERYRLQRNLAMTLIRSCKAKYFEKLNTKLQDPKLGTKKWWGIVKSLYGSKIHSSIPPLFDDDRIITDAKEKATIFNQYFITQCKVDNNDALIPNIIDFQNSRFISHLIHN